VVLTSPATFLERFGRFGFTSGAGGSVEPDAWHNVTMSPDVARAAEVIAALYPHSGGRQIDGVIVLDPFVLAKLLDYTGPIQVPGLASPVTSATLAQSVLRDQYQLDSGVAPGEERVDLLAAVAPLAVQRILTGSLPGPAVLADDLGPLADEGRLMLWARDPDAQRLIVQAGLAGNFPRTLAAAEVAITIDNVAGNKVDAYLQRSVSCRATTDRATGEVQTVVDLQLHNGAPASGAPGDVIGNPSGLPPGTNEMLLSAYTGVPLQAVTRDGVPLAFDVDEDGGRHVAVAALAIPPGATTVVTLTTEGRASVPQRCSVALAPMADGA
jgi:hypothetical protein